MTHTGLRCLKKYVKFKSFERKMKSSFIICEDFVTILVPEDNRKQNPEKSYTSKASKTCCLLSCKPFKSYLDKYTAYNFIKSKYCTDI